MSSIIQVALVISVMAGAGDNPEVTVQNQVSEIYVPAGPVDQTLPELIVQLGVPAGLVLGEFRLTGRMESPSHRITQEFEFTAGTIEEALNAFAAAHPYLSWSHTDNIVHLRRHIDGEAGRLPSLLQADLDAFTVSNQSYDSVMRQMREAIKARHPDLLVGQTFHPSEQDAYVNPIMPLRVGLKASYSFTLEDADVKTVLDQLATANGNAFWFAYHDVESGGFRPGFAGVDIGLTTWSSLSRTMSLKESAVALDPQNKDLMGYRTVDLRVEATQRELTRRHHYHPQEVIQSLVVADVPKTIAMKADTDRAIDLLRWMITLDEPELTETVIEAVRDLPVGERRIDILMWAFPREQGSLQSIDVEMLWRKLAAEDPDPAVRQIATKWLKSIMQATE